MSERKYVFNVFTGSFDIVDTQDNNTSYYIIPDGKTVTIDDYKMMIVESGFTIEGSLIVNGILKMVEFT